MSSDRRTVVGGNAHVTIVHPWDPWRQGIGGFDTFLDGFLRYAPSDWVIELIGTTGSPDERPVGEWSNLSFDGRQVAFFPALVDTNPNLVRRLPLSLRFAWAVHRLHPKVSGRVVTFHRFESRLGVHLKPGEQRQVFYLHNHPGEVRSQYSAERWRWLAPIFRWLLVAMLRRASLMVAVDPRTPAWVRQRVPELDGRVLWQRQWADPALFSLPDPGNRQALRERFRRKLSFDPGLRLLIFVGRFERQKDPMLLLHIFEQARATLGPIGLILVGEGRLRRQMNSVIEKSGLGPWVRFIPPLERGQLMEVYQAADAAVCTSGFEAGPRIVFEAMACGVPVVSFDVGQVASVIDQNEDIGVLVTNRTEADFVDGLVRVLSQPLDAERASRVAEKVAALTPQAALRPILSAYSALTSGGIPGQDPDAFQARTSGSH